MKKRLALLVLLAVLSNCSKKNKQPLESDPQLLYQDGVAKLNDESFKDAINEFEQIEKEHPASDFASNALMLKSYSYFQNGQFDEAISSADDFIRQYPGDKNIDYVYYLRAICYYDQIVDLGRDQTVTLDAVQNLESLINLFPGSKYAKDAKWKLDLANNNLAGKQMEIGRFYLKQGEALGAINRFKSVIESYNRSVFIPEALYRMAEIYYYLGVEDQVEKYILVLKHNFGDNIWYFRSMKFLNK